MNRPPLDAANSGTPALAHRAWRTRWRRGWRWLRWALLGLLLSLALMLAWLHWWLLPRIDQWRPALEHYASQASGLQLQLGRLQAQATGLLPSLVVWDVQARTRDGRMALHVPQAKVELSWQMLWRQGVASLVLHRPALYLSAAAGPASAAATAPAPEAATAAQPASGPLAGGAAGAAVWRWLQRQPELRVEQGSLIWQQQPAGQVGPAQALWALHHIDWQLRHTVLGRHQWQLSLVPQPPEGPGSAAGAPAAAVRIEGQWRGNWGGAQPGLPDGRWQLQLQAVPVQQLQPILQTAQQWARQTGRPWPQAWQALAQPQAVSGQVDAQLRLRLRQGQLARADASVQLGQWQMRDASVQAAPLWLHWEQAQARLTLLRQEGGPGTHWHLTLEPLQLARGRWQWRSGPMQLSLQLAPGQHWSDWRSAQGQLQWSEVELAALAALLQPPQPTAGRAAPAWRQGWQAVQHALARWQPAGRLQELALSWRGTAGSPASGAARAGLAGALARALAAARAMAAAAAGHARRAPARRSGGPERHAASRCPAGPGHLEHGLGRRAPAQAVRAAPHPRRATAGPAAMAARRARSVAAAIASAAAGQCPCPWPVAPALAQLHGAGSGADEAAQRPPAGALAWASGLARQPQPG
ncbi:MAG: hypothetical protein Q4A97_07985 [Comamonadaceae bacterium]|nr:hypothetical protein [Comamonadaceae bacterium]